MAVAAGALEGMAAIPMNEREQAHHDAIAAWVGGDWIGASRILDQLLVRWPTDLLALQVGHLLDFFVGDAANLRDRPGRSLLALDPEHPHTAVVRGMQAFGLEESRQLQRRPRRPGWPRWPSTPTTCGRSTRSSTPTRCAVGSPTASGSSASAKPTGDPATSSRSTTGGTSRCSTSKAATSTTCSRIYDAEVHHAASQGVPLEMLDASALLWRLRLDGVSDGGRFAPLADAWATRTDGRPGTSSTTSTPSWRWWARGGSPRPKAWWSGWPATSTAAAPAPTWR